MFLSSAVPIASIKCEALKRLYIKPARWTYKNLQVIKHAAMSQETSLELSTMLVIQNLQMPETELERLQVQSINCLRDHENYRIFKRKPAHARPRPAAIMKCLQRIAVIENFLTPLANNYPETT
jgi:hypothetical protein